ncbi:MAG TPA: DegT/DnrJ/EryC1/StrS family aminotransferase [Gemmatimonadales bacterium]|nr:DegT/DnrJ/EryC1/StrS family aminotransferase [Gemmatimonadales bacterium]
MRLRAQLPVYSPLPLGALASGFGALLVRGARDRVVERVRAALTAAYHPAGLLLTDSGTSALALALKLAARERPGPAALPAYCCYDIATAADAAGVEFLLYDLDPATLGPDEASLRRALDAGAGTVVVAHLYGIPVDVPAVTALAHAAGAVVIEDAAQGAGVLFGDAPAGTLGRWGVLSFGRGKGVTGGRGGALLANAPATVGAASSTVGDAFASQRDSLAAARTSLREPVALFAQWLLARPAVYGVPLSLPFLRLGETVYRAPAPAAHLSPFAASVLARTIRLGAAEAERRRANAKRLLAAARLAPGLELIDEQPDAVAGYLRLPLRAGANARAAADQRSAHRLGIWPGYPRSLADLHGFGERRVPSADGYPGARELARRLITLPTHGRLGEADLVRLGRWMARGRPS